MWDEYNAVVRGREDWDAILKKYDVEWLVLDKGAYHSTLLPLVEKSGHWHKCLEFRDAVVFERGP